MYIIVASMKHFCIIKVLISEWYLQKSIKKVKEQKIDEIYPYLNWMEMRKSI